MSWSAYSRCSQLSIKQCSQPVVGQRQQLWLSAPSAKVLALGQLISGLLPLAQVGLGRRRPACFSSNVETFLLLFPPILPEVSFLSVPAALPSISNLPCAELTRTRSADMAARRHRGGSGAAPASQGNAAVPLNSDQIRVLEEQLDIMRPLLLAREAVRCNRAVLSEHCPFLWVCVLYCNILFCPQNFIFSRLYLAAEPKLGSHPSRLGRISFVPLPPCS